MSKLDNNEISSAILDAIRAKRESRSISTTDIARFEEALLADIEAFDIDVAEARAHHEHQNRSGAGTLNASLAFPEIAPTGKAFHPAGESAPVAPSASVSGNPDSCLLAQLRQQAAHHQQAMHAALAERNTINESIDQALKQTFFFLHEFVQQLNIVKPDIPRKYPLIEHFEISQLAWQEGFADYRTQAQSAGALLEMVSFSYQLQAPGSICIERDDLRVDRFRAVLFDYGLQFSCKEFRNERRYVERAEFEIRSQLSVSARWRADFAQGQIILETRNLERLGSIPYQIRPALINQTLLDEFGRLVLGQPNRFRDLIRR